MLEMNEELDKLIQNISQKKDITAVFLEYSKKFPEQDFSSIKKLSSWLGEIDDDVREKRVPLFFFSTILSSIENIRQENLLDQLIEPSEDFVASRICDFKSCLKYVDSYKLYKTLKFAQESLVLVGANGCGKTTLANLFQSTMHYESGIVIPAHRMMIIPTFESIPSYERMAGQFNDYQKRILSDKQSYQANKTTDVPYQIVNEYGTEMKFVLEALIAEKAYTERTFCQAFKQKGPNAEKFLRSKIDDVFEIWNYLFEHRQISCEDGCNFVIYDGVTKYPAYQMSDGERSVLYVAGRVILAPQNAVIIVDEPEMYLHQAVVQKLWDKLELVRNDCKFIYLTHNLDFAESRNFSKYWIKSVTHDEPISWNIEEIDFSSEIPETMLLQLLGSRKNILFCEGERDSLDTKIFEVIFSDYTVTPVGNCSSVISYTKAFNKLTIKSSKAIGIVDRDFLEEKQIENLGKDKIYTYDVAEIENLLLAEDFIKQFAAYKHESVSLDDLKDKVISSLKKNVENQISKWIVSYINFKISGANGVKGSSLEEVVKSYENFKNSIDISDLHEKRLTFLNAICDNREYGRAILVYNNKGLINIVEQVFQMKKYQERAIDFLKQSPDAQKILKDFFPKEIIV